MLRSARRLGRWTMLVAALAVAALAIACGDDDDEEPAAPAAATEAPAAPFKVGFLYVGTVDDGGYNQAAYLGEVAVNADAMFETINAENVPESAEAERVMQQMIADGATIIFPTSFGHLDPAIRVAEQHRTSRSCTRAGSRRRRTSAPTSARSGRPSTSPVSPRDA